jgi:hypothetical protein
VNMRIAWATPFNRRSAIGRNFSLPVARELVQRGHCLEIVRTEIREAAALPALEIEVPISAPGFADRVPVEQFDAVVINWGDDLLFHGGALALVVHAPALAILHDSDMRSFTAAAADLYKTPVEHFTRPLHEGCLPSEVEADCAQVLAWFASLASGAVIHDRRYLEPVRAVCPGPTRLIPGYSSASVAAYVDALLPLVNDAIVKRPLLEAGFQFGTIFDACGASYDDPAIERIASTMAELFGSLKVSADKIATPSLNGGADRR